MLLPTRNKGKGITQAQQRTISVRNFPLRRESQERSEWQSILDAIITVCLFSVKFLAELINFASCGLLSAENASQAFTRRRRRWQEYVRHRQLQKQPETPTRRQSRNQDEFSELTDEQYTGLDIYAKAKQISNSILHNRYVHMCACGDGDARLFQKVLRVRAWKRTRVLVALATFGDGFFPPALAMGKPCRRQTEDLAASKSLTEKRLLERGIQLEFFNDSKNAAQTSAGENGDDDDDDDNGEDGSDSKTSDTGDAAAMQALYELTDDIATAFPPWVSAPDILELVQNKLERMQIVNKLCKHFRTQFGKDFQGVTLGNNPDQLNRM